MKFAERLAAHITPEWQTQYIKYDEMKDFLYHYEENAPIQDDEHLLQRYYFRADEQFFQFADRELIKINAFFAEKLAEAQRKYENLKSGLKETNSHFKSNLRNNRQRKKSNDEEDDDQEDEDPNATTSEHKEGPIAGSKLGLLKDRVASGNKKLLAESADAASSLTKRIVEKNKERQLKNQKYKKEHDLKLAFSEFYLSLILLQNYQTLNNTGFRKILKKHDKVFKTDRGAEWHKMYVETAPFNLTKIVDTLITNVENLFTQHLEGGDRQRAMKRLRVPPFEEKQSPWTTFRLGLFVGMIFILLPVVLLCSGLTIVEKGELSFNWKIAMKLYRSPLLIIIHIFFIGLNSYGWSRSGVNHVLIFEIDPRNHLTYQQLLEISSFFGTMWFLSLISFVVSSYYNIDYYVFPLTLVSFLTIYFLNPLQKFQYSTRSWLMKILWYIFTAPFYKVAFADFWLADQLTSFVFLFQDIQFFICWFVFSAEWAPLRNFVPGQPCLPKDGRDLSDVYNLLGLLLSGLPAWFRFMQCLRRYKDTAHAFPHLANAFKYATSFFSIGAVALKLHFSSMYESDWQNPFFYLWFIIQIGATCYKLWWDYKMDWGFFDKNAGENRFLRETIVYSSKNYYYFAIVQNFLLRFIWLVGLYDFRIKGETYKDIVTTLCGLLEVFRRFIWNFFRLENEHLNNCGQFRAVRDISISPIQATDLAVIEKMMDSEDGVVNRQHTLNTKTTQHNPQLSVTKKLTHITKRFTNNPQLTIQSLFNSSSKDQDEYKQS